MNAGCWNWAWRTCLCLLFILRFFLTSYPTSNQCGFFFPFVNSLSTFLNLSQSIHHTLILKFSVDVPSVLVWVVCVLHSRVFHPSPLVTEYCPPNLSWGSRQSTAGTVGGNTLRWVLSVHLDLQTSPSLSWGGKQGSESNCKILWLPCFCVAAVWVQKAWINFQRLRSRYSKDESQALKPAVLYLPQVAAPSWSWWWITEGTNYFKHFCLPQVHTLKTKYIHYILIIKKKSFQHSSQDITSIWCLSVASSFPGEGLQNSGPSTGSPTRL